MTHSIKRALALLLALLLAIPAFAFAEPLDDELEIAYEEAFEVEESDVEEAADEVTLDLSELDQEEETLDLEEEVAVEDEASDEAALIVADPAFVQSKTIDGVTITVKAAEGVFPADAQLSVEKVEMPIAGEVDGEVAAAYTYDIKVLDAEGNEQYQPDDDELIEINFNMAEVANDDYQTVVFHITDDEETVEELEVYEDGQNALVYTDGFSFYQVVFVYVDKDDAPHASSKVDSGTYTLDDGNVDGVLLTSILAAVKYDGTNSLATLIATTPAGVHSSTPSENTVVVDKTTTVAVNSAASAYVTATEYKHYTNPDDPTSLVYDWIITPTQAFSNAPLDETIYITVTKTINGEPWSCKVYLKSAAQAYVKGATKYYATLKAAVDANETNITILDDVTESSAIELKADAAYTLNLGKKTLTLSNPLKVTKVGSNTTSLAITGAGGKLDGSIELDGGATMTVASGQKFTVTGDITVKNGSTVSSIAGGTYNGAVTATAISGGTFKGAVTVGNITGGTFTGAVTATGTISGTTATFDGAVTVGDRKVSGGKFLTKLDAAKVNTGYTQIEVDGYWQVVSANGTPIKYVLYKASAIADGQPTAYATYTYPGTTDPTPTTEKYYTAATEDTTLWNAAEFADYGSFDGNWYNVAAYTTDLATAIKKGTATKYTAITAGTVVGNEEGQLKTDGTNIVFVGLITPYVASVGTTNYTTLADAGKAAVASGEVLTLKDVPVTGSADGYKLAAGETLKVGFTDAMKTALGSTNDARLAAVKPYVTVDAGNELKADYPTGADYITFTVATHVASVTPSSGAEKFYNKFYNETGDPNSEYALNVALASADNTLSIPKADNEVVIAKEIEVTNSLIIKGFDNILFRNIYGFLKVPSGKKLTVDSADFEGKVTGVDSNSKLDYIKNSTTTLQYQWDVDDKVWKLTNDSIVATLYSSSNTFKGSYASVKEAVAAASAGDVVKLEKADTLTVNADKGEDGIVTVGKNLTINLDGKGLNSNAENTIVVTGGATLTLKGANDAYAVGASKVTNSNTESTAARTILVDNGTLVLDKAAVQKPTGSNYAIKTNANGVLKVEEPATGNNTTYVDGLLDLAGTATITAGGYTDANVAKLLTEGYGATYTASTYYLVARAGAAIIVETGVSYADLKTAVNAATSGQTVKLLANAELGSNHVVLAVGDGREVTIDLNGYDISATSIPIAIYQGTLHLTGTGKVYETADNQFGAVHIKGKATDTTNFSVLTVDEGVTLAGWSGIFIDNRDGHGYGVKVTLNGKAMNPGMNSHSTSGYGIYVNGSINDKTGNVPEINIGSTAEVSSKGHGIYAAGYAKWNIADGAKISGDDTGIEIRAGEMNIAGGTIKSNSTTFTGAANGNGTTVTGAALAISQHSTNLPLKVNVTGGTFTGYYAVYEKDFQSPTTGDDAEINISGGTFTGNNTVDKKSVLIVDAEQTNVKPAISGGSFSSIIPADYCATGYASEQTDPDENGLYTVKPAWTVSFKTQTYNDTNNSLKVNDTKLSTKVEVVKGTTLAEDQLPVYGEGDFTEVTNTVDKYSYAVDYWYDEAVGADTKFVPGETVITKDTTLVAHFVKSVAKTTLSSVDTYYATLEEAVEAWKWNVTGSGANKTSTLATGENEAAAVPTKTLSYLYDGVWYPIDNSLVNIKTANIVDLVDGALSGAASDMTVSVDYDVTNYANTPDFFEVKPVVRAFNDSTKTGGVPVTSAMLEDAAWFKVAEATVSGYEKKLVTSMRAATNDVTVVISSDANGSTILQTVTGQTIKADGTFDPAITGVKHFGYFTVKGDIAASVTVGSDVSYYSSLDAAITYAEKNQGTDTTITLLKSITGLTTATSLAGTYTIDLNGKNVQGNVSRAGLFEIVDYVDPADTTKTAVASNITITDSDAEKPGKVSNSGYFAVKVNGKSNLTIENGKFESKAAVSQYSTGKLTIAGGNFKANSSSSGKTAVQIVNTGAVEITGGTIGCDVTVDKKTGVVTLTGDSNTLYGIGVKNTPANKNITVSGGYIYGATNAINLDANSVATITNGYIASGETTDLATGTYKVSGGFFKNSIAEKNLVTGSYQTNNTDKKTNGTYLYTVMTDAVASYTTASSGTLYTNDLDVAFDKVAKPASGDATVTLVSADATVALVAPLVVNKAVTLDLNGHTLTAAKITADQFAALTAEQKTAKGLTSVADCKYGISVATAGTLTVTDSKDTYTTNGSALIQGAADLEATICVAGTLTLTKGSVTNLGSGNAILDKGTVTIGATGTVNVPTTISSASGIAINVLDGTLTIKGTKKSGLISGTNAVKFGKTATSKTGSLTIAGGNLTGNTGAAVVVDNTGKTITNTISSTGVTITGGTFKAPSGVSPIQTLDNTGAVAVKPTSASSTVAYVSQFVSGGKFSAPLDNATLVMNYAKNNNPAVSTGAMICSTVADNDGLYTIVPMHVVTLDGNGGKFGDKTTITVDVPEGQLVTTAADWALPTYEKHTLSGWKKGSAAFDVEKTKVAATDDSSSFTLTAQWVDSKYTVTLAMNGGTFTEDTAYSTYLWNSEGIRRTYANGTLTLEFVPENTAISRLVLLAASGSYKAELTNPTGTTFNSWRDASDKEVATITADVTLTAAYNYQITFVNDDDSVLQSTMMVYGSTPSRADPTSTKTDHTYIFKAWTPAIAPVTKAETYKATYDIAVATVDGKDYASAEDAVAAAKAAKEAGKDDTITLLEDTTIELKEGEAVKVKPADKATVTAPADQALKTTENEDGTVSYEAVEPVAKVGDTLCATMDDASKAAAEAKAAGEDDTIELLADVEDPYTLKDGEILNVKTDGKALTVKDAAGNEVEGVFDASTGITTYTANVTVTFDTDGGNEIEAQTIPSGSTATKPADPTKENYIFVKWVDAEGAEFDFTKPITADTTVKAVWTTYIHITSRNALLEGAISVQIKIDPLDATILADKDAVVRFSFKTYTEESKEVKLSEFKTDNNGKYVYGAEVVLAHFADDVTVTFVNGEGKNMATQLGKDRTDVTDGYTFSLKALCEANRGDDTPGDRLYEALFDYSTAAQIYFKQGDWQSLKVDEHVTSVTIDDFKDVPTTETTPAADRPEGVKGSYNVTCEGDHTMNVTFTLPAGKTAADYTFTLDGNTVTPVEVSGKYRVEVANVAAEELNEVHTIAISDGAKTFSVKASLLSYFKGKVEKGDEASANMGKAILRYNQAALEVLNAQKQ